MPEMEEMPLEVLLEIGHRKRECRCSNGVMIQNHVGQYYWVSRSALDSTYGELPVNVRQKIEHREHIVDLLSEHVDGIFEFTGKDRAPKFVQVIRAKIGRLDVSESLMK
jgi:hypothetical protein